MIDRILTSLFITFIITIALILACAWVVVVIHFIIKYW